jgi:transposase
VQLHNSYKFYEKANSDSFIDFLKSLQKRYGKILLFADNAAYHKSSRVRKHLKINKWLCQDNPLSKIRTTAEPNRDPVEEDRRTLETSSSQIQTR